MTMTRRTTLTGLAAASAVPVLAGEAKPPILIIGATARMAPALMEEALAQGHAVVALARSPGKITLKHANLKTVKGDVYDVKSIAAAMTGTEIVISCIGPDPEDHKEGVQVDLYSVGIAAILFAMKQKGNKRIIAISSGGTEMLPDAQPAPGGDRTEAFVWVQRNLYGDMRRMEKIIAVSGLEYAVFRPRGFGDGPKTGNVKTQIQSNATDFDQYKDRTKRIPNPPGAISFADLAAVVMGAVPAQNPYLGTSTGIYAAL